MSDVPCITNKCILFPVCKAKEVIICDELRDWFEKISDKAYCHNSKPVWKEVNIYLPCLVRINYIVEDKKDDWALPKNRRKHTFGYQKPRMVTC